MKDHAEAEGREAIQSTFSQCGADAALAHRVAARGGSFFRLLRGLRDYFLASNHSETTVGIFRLEGRNAGCVPICCGVPRHAVQRMAFRQELRTALAHCGSALCYGSRVTGTHPSTGLDPGDGRIVHHGVRIHGVSLELLGFPYDPHYVSCS